MTENYFFESEIGTINITGSSLVQMVGDVVLNMDRGVRLASKKEIRPYSKTSIDISFDENIDGSTCDINVYVVTDFGISISRITYNIINEIKNRMDMVLENIKLTITVTIVGIKSKYVAKRNIKVSRSYDISEG